MQNQTSSSVSRKEKQKWSSGASGVSEFPVKPKPLRVTQVGGEGKDVAILFKEVDVAGGDFSIDLCAAHRHQPEAETAE